MTNAVPRVLELLTYIEQVEKLKSKPAFAVPTEYFVAHQHELKGLPELQFNLQADDGDVWLRIPRMKELSAPVPQDERVTGVQAALDRVLNSAYRELPQSVVDHCRNACVMVVSRWMQKVTQAARPTERDLGYWINAVRSQSGDGGRVALRSALETINRLHPRGKDNELHKYSMRQVDEHDAEYAVHALAFVIREINWGEAVTT